MRALLVLTPIALIGGFAVHQAVSDTEICTEKAAKPSKHAVAAVAAVPAVPAVPDVPAVPAVPAVPTVPHLEGLSRLATLSEDIEIRIPREAIERAAELAEEISLHAEAHADIDIDVRLEEVMHLLEERLSNLDEVTEDALEDLGLTEEFFEELAESIEAAVSIETGDESRVRVRVPARHRH